MARKTMTKEVTHTTIKLSKVSVVEGTPQLEEMEDEVLIGNVTLEKAQKEITKKHGEGVTVYGVHPTTEKYQMKVEDFIANAEKVEPEKEQPQEA